MDPVRVLLISATFAWVAGQSSECRASSTLYDGLVLDLDGRPCFTVDPDHMTSAPRFVSINVSDIVEGTLVWSDHTAQAQAPVLLSPPGACVAYGTRFTGQEVVQPLQPNHRYLMSLSADFLRHGQLENRKYFAYFCVVSAGGASKVQQVRFNEKRKEWDWSVCARS